MEIERPKRRYHMKSMKLRLVPMGAIISTLSGALIFDKGVETAYAGPLVVGIALLSVGLAWR